MNQKGMTLFEVLVSVVILSSGLLMVYRPMLGSLTALHDAGYRLEAHRLLQNELWELQEFADRTGRMPADFSGRTVTFEDKVFEYAVSYRPFHVDNKLYKVQAAMKWKSGSKARGISRMVYVNVR
jgi:prepilin-type N-terminal cleavage/methylation domain-containing protein